MNEDDGVTRVSPVRTGLSRVVEELACATGGVEPVCRVLSGLCGAVAADEVAAGLTAELTRRYLRAVRGAAAGTVVARSWRLLLEHRDDPAATPLRMTVAGVNVLVGLDLAPAVVSSCTLLGRLPGPAERQAAARITAVLADGVREAARADGDRDRDGAAAARGLVLLLLDGRGPWRSVELLWALRGRPAEAEAERAALDRRAIVVGRELLGDPPP